MPSYPANPPWKDPLSSAIASQPVTFFQLATVAEPLVPRVRTLTLSGFFGAVPYKSTSSVPESARNEVGADSDILFVASDSRSEKFADLKVSPNVEAVLYFPALYQQFRVRGKAYPISPGLQDGELEEQGRAAVEAHLQRGKMWDWEKEVRKMWDAQDDRMTKKFPLTTEEHPVPAEFRLLVVVPEEVLELQPGSDAVRTWKAEPVGGDMVWTCS